MDITDPTRRAILDAAIDRSVSRGTLTGERRDVHGWLERPENDGTGDELGTALEAMLDPGADDRSNRLAISAAVLSASGAFPCSGRGQCRSWGRREQSHMTSPPFEEEYQ